MRPPSEGAASGGNSRTLSVLEALESETRERRRWWRRKAATAARRKAERRERETATATSFREMGLEEVWGRTREEMLAGNVAREVAGGGGGGGEG